MALTLCDCFVSPVFPAKGLTAQQSGLTILGTYDIVEQSVSILSNCSPAVPSTRQVDGVVMAGAGAGTTK
jgi:hypothetical protein